MPSPEQCPSTDSLKTIKAPRITPHLNSWQILIHTLISESRKFPCCAVIEPFAPPPHPTTQTHTHHVYFIPAYLTQRGDDGGFYLVRRTPHRVSCQSLRRNRNHCELQSCVRMNFQVLIIWKVLRENKH